MLNGVYGSFERWQRKGKEVEGADVQSGVLLEYTLICGIRGA